MNPDLKLRFVIVFVSAAVPLALGVAATVLAAHGIVVLPLDGTGVGPH
jgi:hypothetical protein